MRNRLNKALLHKARKIAHAQFEQNRESPESVNIGALDDDTATDIDEKPAPDIEKALDHLRLATIGTTFENEIWLVGGYVRDKLLSKDKSTPAHLDDADIVTEADALELSAVLYKAGVTDIAPVVYPRFGTALLRIAGCDIELVTARRESYSDDSRKPETVEPATLAEDALRRDFTINTLMENLHTGEQRDPTGAGLTDFRNGLLRTPLPPVETFADDPLRMMRAVRFASKLGFKIDPATWEAIVTSSSLLHEPKVSIERVRDEFIKTLMTPVPSRGMELFRKSGLLAMFAPELVEMVGVVQNEFHSLPVWDHTLLALDNVVSDEPDAGVILRLATLLHDIGKPSTKTTDEKGRIHFYAHQDVGAEIASKMLRRLKFSNQDLDIVVQLVSKHMRIGEYVPTAWSDAAVRRLVRDAGPELNSLFALHRADVHALAGTHQDMSRAEQLRQRIETLETFIPSAQIDSPLSGDEIMKILGLPAGPRVGEIKNWLVDELIEGRLIVGDKDAAKKAIILRMGSSSRRSD